MTALCQILLVTILGLITPQVSISRDNSFTGRGNESETLLSITVNQQECYLKHLIVSVDALPRDVSAVSLWVDDKQVDKVKLKPRHQTLKLRCGRLLSGDSQLRVCVDISEEAQEGVRLSADIIKMVFRGGTLHPTAPDPASREVLLCRKRLYKPGDYGAADNYWRIPAVLQLMDGTILTVNDLRHESEKDLPNKIDVVSRYSTDGGHSWSEPVYLARNGGKELGYGDPGLAELPDGTVICSFAGGQNYFCSDIEHPQRSYICFSYDHGRTWTEPKEITPTIWGTTPQNPYCARYHSSFFSSGNSLVLTQGEHKGRILIANVMADDDNALCTHAVYSDDGGQNWMVSNLAYGPNGDESKMVELLDGSILMSVRHHGMRAWAISYDGGENWTKRGFWPEICTNACNGDLIRYDDAHLLHSVPNSMLRQDVSIFVSMDEGETWPVHRSICHGASAYSSLTVLTDGTIGAFLEEEHGNGGTELWFESFSMDWLMKGKDNNEYKMIVTREKPSEWQRIACLNWPDAFPYAPEVRFRMWHSGDTLHLEYMVDEKSTKAEQTIPGGPVYKDSCVEIFIQPEVSDPHYYNFEWNAVGRLAMSCRTDRYNGVEAPLDVISSVVATPSLGTEPFAEKKVGRWTLELSIPASALFCHDISGWGGRSMKMNLFKCGDGLTTLHYLTFAPISTPEPDYHRPEHFIDVKFEE